MQQLAQGSRCVAAGTLFFAALDVSKIGFTALYTCPAGRIARVRYFSSEDANASPSFLPAVSRASVVHNWRINFNVVSVTDNIEGLLEGGPTLEPGDQLGVNALAPVGGAQVNVVFSIEEFSLGQA